MNSQAVDASQPTNVPRVQIFRQGTLRNALDEDEFAETEGRLSPVLSDPHSALGNTASQDSQSHLGSGPSMYSLPTHSNNPSEYSLAHEEPLTSQHILPNSDGSQQFPENVTPYTQRYLLAYDDGPIPGELPSELDLHLQDELQLDDAPPPYVPLAADDNAHVEVVEYVQAPEQMTSSATTYNPTDTVHAKIQEAGFDRPTRHGSASSTTSSISAIAPPFSVNVDESSPLYSRETTKFYTYLIPYPQPNQTQPGAPRAPEKFFLYTPLPAFLPKPTNGEKESASDRKQREFQEDMRLAKDKRTQSSGWDNFRAKARFKVDQVSKRTTTSEIDYLARLPLPKDAKKENESMSVSAERRAANEMRELVLVYPDSVESSKEEIRSQFIGAMIEARNKAKRDVKIATSLLPVAATADLVAGTMGALTAIDSIYMYKSIRSAKASRALTERFKTNCTCGSHEHHLRLTLMPTPRMEVAKRYMEEKCHMNDRSVYPYPGNVAPSEQDILETVGWTPSSINDPTTTEDDHVWETSEARSDIEMAFNKGAREWTVWCKKFLKDPTKAARAKDRQQEQERSKYFGGPS